jgi:tetratricopeptide (TPR) repeat protein
LINEFLARAYYQLEEYAEALEAIDASLDVQESVMRHYVRGLILDARGEDDAAAREYEWVLSWSNIFPFPLRDEAQSNLQALR